jgi:hypothetical protein
MNGSRQFIGLVLLAALGAVPSAGAEVLNVFDLNTGANQYYGGFGSGNWVTGPFSGVVPNAGTDQFLSFYGGPGPTLNGIGLTKDLGGVVTSGTYAISFFITKYEGGQPIEFADFTSLRIGGPLGVVTWISTPTPTTDGEWVEWSGTYVADPGDVGGPFYFQAIFNFPEGHSIGLDGPVTATSQVTTSLPASWGGIKVMYRP